VRRAPHERKSAPGKRASPKRWSKRVTKTSHALDLDRGVFKLDDPAAIARSLWRSASRSKRRKSSPYRSAMSMLTFYVNRAGHNLSKRRLAILEKAKDALRERHASSRARTSARS
jgi:hypothetical protein